jgi:hypothetical protein
MPKRANEASWNSFVFNDEGSNSTGKTAPFDGLGRPQPRVVVFGQFDLKNARKERTGGGLQKVPATYLEAAARASSRHVISLMFCCAKTCRN